MLVSLQPNWFNEKISSGNRAQTNLAETEVYETNKIDHSAALASWADFKLLDLKNEQGGVTLDWFSKLFFEAKNWNPTEEIYQACKSQDIVTVESHSPSWLTMG